MRDTPQLTIEAQHDVTGVVAAVANGSTGDFTFGDEGADVVFGTVGVEGNFRPVEDAQQSILVAKQPSEQPVEHHVAGCATLEDAVEAPAQDLSLLRTGNLVVWNKTNGGMGTFYRSKHELVFVW